jgi:chromosome segregation ATPase
MDGAPRLMSMTNVHALSRYRALREQQACRLMQADAAARDVAHAASEAAAAALANAESDRSRGEQRYYRELASTANFTLEMLYRRHDELARLAEAVADANRLAEAASANLVHCEQVLLRSTAEHRARFREVRKLHLVREKLENAMRSHVEQIDELDTEEQGSIRYTNKPGGRSERP